MIDVKKWINDNLSQKVSPKIIHYLKSELIFENRRPSPPPVRLKIKAHCLVIIDLNIIWDTSA